MLLLPSPLLKPKRFAYSTLMARYASPTIELTGHVLQLLVAKQVSMKIWSRELILEVDDHSEPGEGPVKIEFLR